MTETKAITAGREVIAAFNTADWDRLQQVLSDDVVYDETGTRADGRLRIVPAWTKDADWATIRREIQSD
jgi:hypothetical protein